MGREPGGTRAANSVCWIALRAWTTQTLNDCHRARVVLETGFEQAGGLVLDVVDLHGLGVGPLEQRHAAVEVDAMVIDDHPRGAGTPGRRLQAVGDVLTRRGVHRLQRDQFHPLVGQALAGWGQVLEPDAQDDQDLLGADLDRMVDHPGPIDGDVLGGGELGQAEPLQPEPSGGPMGGDEGGREDLGQQGQHTTGATQRDPGFDEAEEQADHPAGVAVAGGADVEPGIINAGGERGFFFLRVRGDLGHGAESGVLGLEWSASNFWEASSAWRRH